MSATMPRTVLPKRSCWAILLIPLFLGPGLTASASGGPAFQRARAVWPAGQEHEMNLHVGFRAVVDLPQVDPGTEVKLTAANVYRLFVNGVFVGYGPARASLGYARVDQWPIAAYLHPGGNLIAIEVAAYNVNNFYLQKQAPFLEAEVVSGEKSLAATAPDGGFTAVALEDYVRKTQRYSFQRPFTEVYRLASGADRWRSESAFGAQSLPLALQEERTLLPRRVPLPDFTVYPAQRVLAMGSMARGPAPASPWKDRSLTNVPAVLDGYPEAEIGELPSIELQRWKNIDLSQMATPLDPHQELRLAKGHFALLDMGLNRAGFLGFHVECDTPAKLYASFDEILTDGDVDFKRLDTVNVLAYSLQPGSYDLESFEPYVAHSIKILAAEGNCRVSQVHIRDYSNPDVWSADFESSDPRLNGIFAAARETFRQNSVDLFTDCPSRERAAWTGDSFFTARAAVRFAANTDLEKNFLENFSLPGNFAGLPPGMLPMLYPGDVIGQDAYIPGYSLWFVLQLAEYAERSGDQELVAALKPRVLALFQYFDEYRNSDGMLEDLRGWVFLEWSDANKYTGGVNFPYNMMYAAALAAAAQLYRMPQLANQAEALRTKIRRMSYDGHFFVDHAVRRNGRLTVEPEHTEAAQYFAFFFGAATPRLYPELWTTLETQFGPDRVKQGAFPDVAPSNVIFGRLMRIELLSQAGRSQRILDEAVAEFLNMAETTGTLWEHVDARASTDHGLMSDLAYVLDRDALGVASLNWRTKQLKVVIPDVTLAFCSGTLPTPDGPVRLEWRRDSRGIQYHLETPPGYTIDVNSAADLPLKAE